MAKMHVTSFGAAVLLALSSVGGHASAAEDLKAAIAAAPVLNVEKVCAPIRATRGGDQTWVPNPDGKTYDLVIRYFEGYTENTHFTMIDLGTGEVRQKHIDRGGTALMVVAPNGKAFGHGLGGILVYDPATNELTRLPGAPNIGGETRPMVVGPDGKVYGTGSADGRALAYQIDPATGKFTDYGKIGPSHEPNHCWGYFILADTNFLYVTSGKLPWYLVAYDLKTGKDSVLLTLDDPDGLIMPGRQNGGVIATVRRSGGKPSETYWLHEGKAVLRKDAKEASPAAAGALPQPRLPAKPEVQGSVMPLSDGTVEFWVRAPEAKAAAPAKPADDARLEDLGWKRISYSVPTYPAPVYQVFALPDGRICGAGGNYLGLFLFDPKTNQVVTSGGLPVSVPVMAWQGDRLYFTGYPRAATMELDVTQPFARKNPLFLDHVGNAGSGVHQAYCMVAAADGRIYIGGGWYRNGEGGGLGWWDPKEKKAGGTSEGMGCYRVTHMTTTGAGRYVVLSTRAVRDQEKNIAAPKQAKVFVYDTAEKKLLRSFETLSGAEHTGAIAGVSGTNVVALTLDPDGAPDRKWNERGSVLYAFDALTGKVVWQRKLPYPVGFPINENYDGTVGFDLKLGPDGKVWTFTGGEMIATDPEKPWGLTLENACLVRVSPEDGAISVVGKVGRVGRMAFLGKDLYLTGGSKYHNADAECLRRISKVAP